jgi:hypothetical protein
MNRSVKSGCAIVSLLLLTNCVVLKTSTSDFQRLEREWENSPQQAHSTEGSFSEETSTSASNRNTSQQKRPVTNAEVLELRMMAHIATASAMCSWTLPAATLAHVDKYLDYYERNFNKWHYDMILAQAQGNINRVGQLEFCMDDAEKSKFDKYVRNVKPYTPRDENVRLIVPN